MGAIDPELLSMRERTVLRLVQRGFQTDEIARELDRSPNTIENQIASARRKLGGVTRRQAARLLHDAEHSGSSTNQPFAIPNSAATADPDWRDAELVREERAIFLPDPIGDHATGKQGVPPHQLTVIAMIVATTLGILVILAATPTLVESFKAFTAWLIRTFY